MVYVDQLGIEDLPLSEMESKLKELKGARWIEINPVRTEEELRLELMLGADPNLKTGEANRLQHEVTAVLAEMAPQARVFVRVVPAC